MFFFLVEHFASYRVFFSAGSIPSSFESPRGEHSEETHQKPYTLPGTERKPERLTARQRDRDRDKRRKDGRERENIQDVQYEFMTFLIE